MREYQYQKVAGFRLPLKDETAVQVRFYGKKVLTIDRRDYFVTGKSLVIAGALSYAGISPTAERRRTVPSPATSKHIGFTTVSGLGCLECRVL